MIQEDENSKTNLSNFAVLYDKLMTLEDKNLKPFSGSLRPLLKHFSSQTGKVNNSDNHIIKHEIETQTQESGKYNSETQTEESGDGVNEGIKNRISIIVE